MRKFLLLPVLFLCNQYVFSQAVNKKPLDPSVFDGWQSIANEQISNDGRWVLYAIKPQQGDAALVITNAKTLTKTRVARADTARFTSDSRFAAMLIKPFYADVRRARIKKKKQNKFPKDTLGIINLMSGKMEKIPSIRSFKLAEDAAVIAYLAPSDTLKKPADNDTSKKAVAQTIAPPTREGATLTVKQLISGKQQNFQYVTDYQLSKNGKLVIYAVTAPRKSKDAKSGLYVFDVEKGTIKTVSAGRGNYRNLVFDEAGKQLAFTAEKNPEKAAVKPFKLYYYGINGDSAAVVAAPESAGMPANWAVSGDGRIYFSKNGSRLFFGTAPIPKPLDTTLVDFETRQARHLEL